MCLLRGTDWIYKYSSCYLSFFKYNRATVKAVSWRRLIARACFQSQVSPCKIYGVQSGIVTGFSRSTSVFFVIIIPPMHYTHLYLHEGLPEGQTDKAWEPSKKQWSSDTGKRLTEKYCHFFELVFKRNVEWVNKPRDEPVTRHWEEANSPDSDACGSSVCGVDVMRCLHSALCACWLAIQWRSVIAVVRVASCKCSNFTHQLQRPLYRVRKSITYCQLSCGWRIWRQ